MKSMDQMDQLAVSTIRLLAADGVEKANSGHPGLPMGAAGMAYVLWKSFVRGSATDPNWIDRDRFVLSAGHGSMLIYALLHLFGYDLSLEDLKRFRQLGSVTPGHPEYGMTPGVEVTTGPLGQGIANAVGLAMAERKLAVEFNKEDYTIFDHSTYVLCGDGDLMEGVSAEAISLAGHHRLGKLIVLYDDNGITIDGSTTLTFTEDTQKRFEAYGWHVLKVNDGNVLEDVFDAVKAAKDVTDKPSLIMVKNVIGYGAPTKAGKSSVHGSPLGKEELRQTKIAMGFDPDESFVIPDAVNQYLKQIIDARELERFKWEEKLESYFTDYPDMRIKWQRFFNSEVEDSLIEDPELWAAMNVKDASRNSGGKFMNWAGKHFDNLFGGSADLNGSTKTYIKALGDFTPDSPQGGNIFYGIREHAMGAIANGIALHGGLRPYGSTFLVFSDYMKPPLRLAALMGLPVIHIFTHDSVAVGEDGPTHQPIEHLLLLRSIPNMHVYRPADGRETAYCWLEALKRTNGPSCIILSRQDLPLLETTGKGAARGAYIVRQEAKERPDLVLVATGSEVSLALEVAGLLMNKRIDARVISMPSVETFLKQDESYKQALIPQDVQKRVSLEMGLTLGWERIIGSHGLMIGIDRFGESGPGEAVMAHLGFETYSVLNRIMSYIEA